MERRSRGCLPRAVRDGGAASLGSASVDGSLRLQEIVRRLRHVVLILLLGFNYGERRWICLRTAMTQLLGFFDLRMKNVAIPWTIYRVFVTISLRIPRLTHF
jgi:hypothetical protein